MILLVPLRLSGAAEEATVTVFDEKIGETVRYVGYNQGHFLPESNTADWLAYAGVNAVRFWASTNVYVTDEDLDAGAGINDFAAFEQRRAALRKEPESRRHLDWPAIHTRFQTLVYPGSNRYVLNPVLDELKKLEIAPIAQLHSGRWGDSWQEHWVQWQRFYAVAYHLAQYAGVEMFMMFNEPDHPSAGGYPIGQYVLFLQIASDAIRAAVEDVNARYGQNLDARILAPVTAGSPLSDWGRRPMASLRTGLNGEILDHNLFDVFANHRYGPTWDHYAREIDGMKEMMRRDAPTGEVLPIMYTEWGRFTTRKWHAREETLDTPYVSRDIAAIYGAALEREVLGMITFKFSNTSRKEYPEGMKSGHHWVREEDGFDTTSARRTAEVVRLFAKGFSGERTTLRAEVDGSSDLKAWASFDDRQNMFFIWCVNMSDDENAAGTLDLSNLPLASETVAILEEVSATAFGEVRHIGRLPPEKSIPLALPPQATALVSFAGGALPHHRLEAAASRTVSVPFSATDRSSTHALEIRHDPEQRGANQAVLLRFSLPASGIERALLRVHSAGAGDGEPAVVQVHVVPDFSWRGGSPAAGNLARLTDKAGYVGGAGVPSVPAGHLTFNEAGGYRAADITAALRRFDSRDVTVLLIAPLRQPEDSGATAVAIPLSKGEGHPPLLDLLLAEGATRR